MQCGALQKLSQTTPLNIIIGQEKGQKDILGVSHEKKGRLVLPLTPQQCASRVPAAAAA